MSKLALIFLLLSCQVFAGSKALIYAGPGACDDDCAKAAFEMAERNGFTPSLAGAHDLTGTATADDANNYFKDVALWIQPGGTSLDVLTNMTPQMVSALRSFVNQGGGYVGFCAGAFSATSTVGTTSHFGFDIFPGRTILYGDKYQADIVKVKWDGKDRYVYWEGGPYLQGLDSSDIVATYPNGQAAAAHSTFGKGRVFISGFHPEAPQWWRDSYGLKDPDGLDYDIADEMINWVTGK